MINTVHDLLVSLRDKGVSEIEPYLNIGHNPTIGDMYEGLTKEILNSAVFKGLNLKVVSGKIKNGSGELSRQIDCMLVIGDGKSIPFTVDYLYDINQVIAVIEVKKNLFSSELDSAYNNLLSVFEITDFTKERKRINLLRGAFKTITGSNFPETDSVSGLSKEHRLIFHSLVLDYCAPVRIIFGYDGFKTEHSLREHFIDYIENHISDGGTEGFGAVSLPSLIICNNNSLVKTNGFPYILCLKHDWLLYASYNKNPLYIFLEVIWTKLVSLFDISDTIFGEDLSFENLRPLLVAIAHENGWEYAVMNYSEEELKEFSEMREWNPVKLSEAEFVLVNMLCLKQKVCLDDQEFLNFIKSCESTLEEIIEYLKNERIICIDNNKIKLLTEHCQCIITENGYYAGENKDGRLTKWMLKNQQNSL